MTKTLTAALLGTRGYPSYYGGFETAVRNLAPFLVDSGWDVTVYGRKGSTKTDDPTIDRRVKTVTTATIEQKSLSTLTNGYTSFHHASKRKPDVALVMNFAHGFWLPVLRKAGIPTIVNVDGIEWERDKWGRFASSVFLQGAKRTAATADHLVFDSREIARRWHVDFGRDGTFIPYGATFADLPFEIEPGLGHRGYALMVARLVPENTVGEFFQAVELLPRDTPVVIVGSSGYGGEFDSRARSLADARSNVTWMGHLSDDRRLHALWQHAGVYFHGHSVGGTNPALVQAMALGSPIVARDTAYNREVLHDSGVFTSRDPAEIANKISELIIDRGRQNLLSKLATTRASEHYTWEKVNTQYESLMRAAASRIL